MLQNKCGIVLMATDYLSKRIQDGVRKRKKGYNEIFSRIGRKFILVKGVEPAEVNEICKLNGVDNQVLVAKILEDYEGDLRRVERAVHRIKRKAA